MNCSFVATLMPVTTAVSSRQFAADQNGCTPTTAVLKRHPRLTQLDQHPVGRGQQPDYFSDRSMRIFVLVSVAGNPIGQLRGQRSGRCSLSVFKD